MVKAAIPNNEIERLKALGRYNLLDTLPEEDFERITFLASLICQAPISLISLVDENRQFFKSHFGVEVSESNRDLSFCAHAINQPESIFEIEDLRLDNRFHDNDFVTGQPNVVFYAGVPLVTNDGFALGTLCVIDTKPRKLTNEQKEGLDKLSKQVMNILDARQKQAIEQSFKLIDFTFNNSSMPIYLVKEDSSIYDLNDAACEGIGYKKEELLSKKIIDLDANFNKESWASHWAEIKAKGKLTIETSPTRKDGKKLHAIVSIHYLKQGDTELICSYITDITEKKKQEEHLKLVDFAFRNSKTPVHIINKDATLFDFNEAAHQTLGYTKEDYKAITIPDIDPNYQQNVWPKHWEELKEAGSLKFETILKKKNSELINVYIEANFINYGNRELNYTFLTDITEKKKLEQQMKLLDYSYRNTDTAIFFILEDGLFFDFNEATSNMLGYSYDEFIGKTIMDINPIITKEYWANRWRELSEKPNQTVFTKFKKKDQSFIDVEVKTSVITLGDVTVNFGFFIDITEKKKAEENLKLTKYTIDNAAWGIAYFRRDGSVFNINLAFAKIYGYSSLEEITNKTVYDFNSDFTEKSFELYWEDIKAKKRASYVAKRRKNDDSLIDLEITSNYMQFGDEELICAFVNDITEKLEIENQLKLVNFSFRNSPTAMTFISSDSTFYDFNDATCNLFGYTREEFKKLSIIDINPLFNIEEWPERWNSIKANGGVPNYTSLKKKDGSFLNIELRASIIQYGDLELNFATLIDITEKLEAEKELKHSNERYEYASIATSDVIWEWDIKEDSNYFSPNYTKVFGHPILGLEYGTNNIWRRTVHPDDLKNVLDIEAQAVKKVFEKWEISYRIRKIDGEYAIVLDRGFAIKDETGEVIRLVGAIQDITEKKQAEKELERSIQRYHYATLATSDVVWEADLMKNEVFISKNFTIFYGHPIEDGMAPMENNVWRQNIHPDDAEKVIKNQYSILDSKNNSDNWIGEYRLRRADGSYAIVIDKTFAIKDEQGNVIRMVGALQDITKKKEEEERLKLMESVILNTNDSIMITDAEPLDLPGPRILFVNKAFTEMTGYNAEEVMGKTPRILQNEDTDGKELERLYKALKKWEPCEVTVSNTKKNGEKFWLNMRITPIANEKGWFTHWIAIEKDVTKEKEAEQEKLKLLEELIQNNLELKQFSYITSHNLRSPLMNLLSICDLIKTEKIEDKLTAKLIEGFKKSTYNLNETLNDLIEILIIKENRNLQTNHLYFEDIFNKIKDSLSLSMLEKRVTVIADFSEAPFVNFTNAYLESILLNLFTNSIKYRHPERLPIITIKTGKDANGKTKLTFSDNGLGINMSTAKDKIFGLYKRFHNNSDSKGIGLYLIHSQITALGGKIEVESEVNIGTTFTITFK